MSDLGEVKEQLTADLPTTLRQRYRESARPMLRWWGLLMTNTRMFFLFLFLFLDRPAWFFWLEVTVLNVLLACLIVRQEKAETACDVDAGEFGEGFPHFAMWHDHADFRSNIHHRRSQHHRAGRLLHHRQRQPCVGRVRDFKRLHPRHREHFRSDHQRRANF